MSIAIPANKDISQYRMKIMGKFSIRALVCSAGLVAGSLFVGFYNYFILARSFDELTLLACVPFVLPFCLGFVYKPLGLPFEQYMVVHMRYITQPQTYYFSNEDYRARRKPSHIKTKSEDKLLMTQASECLRPTEIYTNQEVTNVQK